jgi:hypothetical protein
MNDFLLQNWAELTLAFLAFLKVAVNLAPSEKPRQVFGYIDTLVNMIIADRIKPNNEK